MNLLKTMPINCRIHQRLIWKAYIHSDKIFLQENLILTVNHYLLVDDINKIAYLFDTGTNAKETIDF